MTFAAGARPAVNVVELNPYAPQPFALTEVALCLRDSIRAAGHASEHLSNTIDPSAFSIILGGSPTLAQEMAHADPRRCAIFNFEQLGSTSNLAGPAYRRWLRGWLVVDYHASNIAFLKAENGPGQQAFELPIVPSPLLASPEAASVPKSVDVLFYGTLSERRQAVLRQLQDCGLTVEIVSGAYGHELAPAVLRARLVLHIHYYESALFPIARFLQPVAQGVPIVCEHSLFSTLGDWSGSGIAFAHYEALGAACQALLASPQEQAARALAARDFAGRIDFATPFQEMLGALQARNARPPPPPAPAPAPTSAPAIDRPIDDDPNRPLTNAEIEAILAQEAADLPEAHLDTPALAVVKREPGQGRFGSWVAWLLIAFILMSALQAFR